MKKLFYIMTTMAALSGMSAFGQGQALFTGAVRGVWDDWQGSATLTATNNVAFLFANNTTNSLTPLVDSLAFSVATNTTSASWSLATAWNDILNDPNYHLATNSASSTLATVLCAANASWSYNGNA